MTPTLIKDKRQLRFDDMRLFQQVKVQHKWLLSFPHQYRSAFTWRPVSDLVTFKEGVQGSRFNLDQHFDLNPEVYAPYARLALETALEHIARIEWYDSKEPMFHGLIFPVPKTMDEQKALVDFFMEGKRHPVYGDLPEQQQSEVDWLTLQKEDALKRWAE